MKNNNIQLLIRKLIKEDKDFDIPAEYQDFDEFEFHSSAKDAAQSDIEKEFGQGSFEDIGKSKFEKGMKEKDFAEKMKQANLRLGSDEKELGDIQKTMQDKKSQEDKLKDMGDKFGGNSFSLNEGLKKGEKYQISHNSGVYSGKIVTIIDKSRIKTDGRGVPINTVTGEYKPVDWKNEEAIEFEDGSFGIMFKNRLGPIKYDEYTKAKNNISESISTRNKQLITTTLNKLV